MAFADVNRRPRTVTADRVEFLGRHGSVAAPGRPGPRRSLRTHRCGDRPLRGDPGPSSRSIPTKSTEIVFLLGEAEDLDRVRTLVRRYWDSSAVSGAWRRQPLNGIEFSTQVQVHTPDPAFDLLLNRWLLYQVISCRLRARSAFYQSGGAFGFRDQLQDVLCLLHAAPEVSRAHILHAASRQFVEGDVQHWWHPPEGRGVRTRISDDMLWLPYATALYVKTTGDSSILDENVPYLKAPLLEPGQDDDYQTAGGLRGVRFPR